MIVDADLWGGPYDGDLLALPEVVETILLAENPVTHTGPTVAYRLAGLTGGRARYDFAGAVVES